MQSNKKISHTVRLMRLPEIKSKGSYRGVAQQEQVMSSRVFVIRRISGHLRRDKDLWTFIYFCHPYTDLSNASLVSDIPGNVQPHLTSWITNFLGESSPSELLANLEKDGFGLVQRVLREIKSTWKLLLNELEVFLENLVGAIHREKIRNLH
jgi:hypothetical protein